MLDAWVSSRLTRNCSNPPASTCGWTDSSACSSTPSTHIDPSSQQDDLTSLVEPDGDEPFVLHPGEFVLGSTFEQFTLPDDLAGRLEGKSSLGRLGLLTHSTAGFIDPGFSGHITLELSNVANLPITLYPGMKIGQISFLQMTTEAEHPYGSGAVGSKYQHQVGPRPSRYFENFRPRQWAARSGALGVLLEGGQALLVRAQHHVGHRVVGVDGPHDV